MGRRSPFLLAAILATVAGCQTSDPSEQGNKLAGKPTAQMAAVLDAHASLQPKPIETLEPAEARRQPSIADAATQLQQNKGDLSPEPKPVMARVESGKFPGPDQVEVPVRIYTPKGNGPFPVIVYFHGGGWVLADLDTYDASCRGLADGAGAVVVSVDYRRAPEFKFPAAHEDCYAALQHVMANAAQFGGDPARVAVAGESAGGNLATGTCIMAKDRGGRMPIHQLLVYPIANYDTGSASYREHANAKPLNAAMMTWFFNQYLPGPGAGSNVLISPVRATSETLKALPPATVITAEIDPLRTEGVDYARRLKEAGVDTVHRNYNGVTHEFFGLAALVNEARDAQQFACQRLKQAFGAR